MERTVLDGQWMLRAVSPRKGSGIAQGLSADMKIPGSVHAALMDSGLIGDPYKGAGENDAGWIALSGWEVSRKFTLRKIAGTHAVLRITAPERYAEVAVNGRKAGEIHPGWGIESVDVTGFVNDGENTLSLLFPGSMNEWTEPSAGEDGRKTESGALESVGILGNTEIISGSAYIVNSVTAEAVQEDGRWILRVSLAADVFSDTEAHLSAEINHRKTEKDIILKKGAFSFSFDADPGEVALWWPRGTGAQPIYPLTVSVNDDSWEMETAFRTAGFSSSGTVINGRNIFLKGARWNPLDRLPSRTSRTRNESVMRSTAEAGMNAIWIEGCIVPDYICGIADREGIMIIQEDMEGAEEQVSALRHHPSLLAVSGNESGTAAFGIPSLPGRDILLSFSDAPFNISSAASDAHGGDASGKDGGTAAVLSAVAGDYLFPETLDNLLYLCQISALEPASEFFGWLRIEGRCHGAFLSSLADRWPSISPSALDWKGRWKLLQYGARLFFSPLAPILICSGENVGIYLVNDTPEAENAELSIKIRTFSGSKKETREYGIHSEPFSVVKVAEVPLSRIKRSECFLYVKMSTKDILRERTLLLDRPKKLKLEDPRLTYEIAKSGQRSIAIKLRAEKPAFSVVLDSGSVRGIFSDNIISVRPSAEKSIVFRCEEDADEELFRKNFTLSDLYSAMH